MIVAEGLYNIMLAMGEAHIIILVDVIVQLACDKVMGGLIS